MKPSELKKVLRHGSLDATFTKQSSGGRYNHSSSHAQGASYLQVQGARYTCHWPQVDLGGGWGTGERSQDGRSLSYFWNQTQTIITTKKERGLSTLHVDMHTFTLHIYKDAVLIKEQEQRHFRNV